MSIVIITVKKREKTAAQTKIMPTFFFFLWKNTKLKLVHNNVEKKAIHLNS